MALTFHSVGNSPGASSSSIVITAPSSIQVGDYLIACLTFSNTATVTPASGFSSVKRTANGDLILETFSKVADSGDAAAGSFTFSLSASTTNIGSMLRFSGQDASPIGTSSQATGTDVTVNPAAISTSFDGDMVILVGGSNDDGTWTTSVANGTATERTDITTSVGNAASLTVATAVLSSAGSSGTITITRNDSTDEMCGHAFILLTAPQNVTATPALLTATFSIPIPTPTSNNSATPAIFTATFTLSNSDAAIVANRWSNQDKNSSSLSNQDKNSASWTNQDKNSSSLENQEKS